ncbi:MAG: PepSY domain-containing protein [Rhodospirillales bacterium]|jgi:hypothetical protein
MKTSFAFALVALSLLAAPSFASERERSAPAAAPKLTLGEVDARVRENGYVAVRSIELKRDGSYEVKAIDAENRRTSIRVDGNTGAFSPDDDGRRSGTRERRDGGDRR